MTRDEFDSEKVPPEEETRKNQPPKHGKKWSDSDIEYLLQSISNGVDWVQIADLLERKFNSIQQKFGNLVITGMDNVKLAESLLSSTGGSPPPNDPKNSISGVSSTPPDDRCTDCGHLLGLRCETCGNCLNEGHTVKTSSEDFFFSNDSLDGHDVNIDLDEFGQKYIDIKLRYKLNQQTENEKLREWVWDYIESMGGKIDREKIRREQPLDDYETYGDVSEI